MATKNLEHGELGAAISQAVVRLMAESTGRGPTQARTTIDPDLAAEVFVLAPRGEPAIETTTTAGCSGAAGGSAPGFTG
jgi:hypothetical protein